MSENLISENENTASELNKEASETPTATPTTIGQTENATETAANVQETEAVANSAVVKIEGQEFPLPVSIAAEAMAERRNDSKFVPGGTAKKAREMYRWFKLMNFTGDVEVETVLAELNKIASFDAKTRTAAEMKEAVDAVILATSKRARKLLKTEQLDALEF